jgi:hypothetical protein
MLPLNKSCVGLLLLGHVYMVILVFVCQAVVFRELSALFSTTHQSSAEVRAASSLWQVSMLKLNLLQGFAGQTKQARAP